MRTVFEFFKSTLIGGLFVLVPIGMIGFIGFQAVQIGREAIKPVVEMLPVSSVLGTSLAVLIAVGIVLLICFLAGLLAQSALTQRLIQSIERLLFSSIPGYALMKNVGENLIGIEGREGRKAVIVEISNSHQLGFQMDLLPDDRVVVFIPNVPNAMTGTLHILDSKQVQPLSISIANSLDILGRLGIGLSKEWNQNQQKPN